MESKVVIAAKESKWHNGIWKHSDYNLMLYKRNEHLSVINLKRWCQFCDFIINDMIFRWILSQCKQFLF